MFCTYCGKPANEARNFCPHCGHETSTSTEAQSTLPKATRFEPPSSSHKFKFRCPCCNRKLEADSQQIGSSAICPNCRSSVRVARGGIDGGTFAGFVFLVVPIFCFLFGFILEPPTTMAIPPIVVTANAILFVLRLDKLGWNRNYAWLIIVPFVNLVFAIYLACAKPK